MKTPAYLDLSRTASQRLATLRKANPANWREAREYGFGNWRAAYCDMSQGFNGASEAHRVPVWYTHTDEQFRGERFADDCEGVNLRHTGWYTDAHQEGKARGIVGRLSHDRFIAGYYWSDNGERVYFNKVFTDEREAAQMADAHAESFADIAREHSERFDAAQTLETEIEDAFTRLRECIALRHNQCMEYVRDEIGELIEAIREKRETLARDYSGVL